RAILRRLVLFSFIFAGACSGKTEPPPKENVYAMTATIVSRDPSQNTVNLDNREVPGVMEAMRMDYTVRNAKVAALPPDGTAVEVKLHESDGRYWVTDVAQTLTAPHPVLRSAQDTLSPLTRGEGSHERDPSPCEA